MSIKKIAVSTIILFLCSCFLASQSLVEVAKQEKERRAKLKGKKIPVVTNETLQKKKLEPAISYKPIKSPYEEILSISEVPKGRLFDNIKSRAPSEKYSSSFTDIKSLEDRWQKAKESVALLTLKLKTLQHEYFSMGDMTPRSHIQQQISDTYLKLQKTQKDVEKAKKDLDKARKKQKNESAKIDKRNLKSELPLVF